MNMQYYAFLSFCSSLSSFSAGSLCSISLLSPSDSAMPWTDAALASKCSWLFSNGLQLSSLDDMVHVGTEFVRYKFGSTDCTGVGGN